MSKVITFSTAFPKYHPKAGQPTYFVERLHKSLDGYREIERLEVTPDLMPFFNFAEYGNCDPKHHTIRSGNRWKVGDKFSPRIWSEIPYQSKQIIIAPDIEIKKIYDFYIDPLSGDYVLDGFPVKIDKLKIIATNDGFTELDDFELWFKLKKGEYFYGQIICWNDEIDY